MLLGALFLKNLLDHGTKQDFLAFQSDFILSLSRARSVE